jgi:glyoxylase-like metal-dependent hydrolase (beta-lactamase superfamily II)
MESKFFTAVKIAEGSGSAAWQIRGVTIDNAYLLEGADSALLIDTLTGAGNLRSFCRELTDKPIHVALTHGHADHAGGCFDFGECFIHPEDIRMLYQGGTVERRKGFIARFGGAPFLQDADFTPPAPLRTFPIYDGSTFDLGGRRVQAVGVPGHTRGSLVFIDFNTRIAFLGDACNTNTLLHLDDSTSIPDYKAGLLHFKERLPEVDTFWSGHGKKPLPLCIIDEALTLCDRILAGTDDAEEVTGRGPKPIYYARRHDTCTEFSANIGYYKDWIQKAPVPLQPPLSE